MSEFVDELANEIRRVDGDNSLGAGALAEALLPFLNRRTEQEVTEEVVPIINKFGAITEFDGGLIFSGFDIDARGSGYSDSVATIVLRAVIHRLQTEYAKSRAALTAAAGE